MGGGGGERGCAGRSGGEGFEVVTLTNLHFVLEETSSHGDHLYHVL